MAYTVGDTPNKKVSITPSSSGTVAFTSSNTSVAVVAADGTVSPVAAGTAEITATVDGKATAGKCVVTVADKGATLYRSPSTLTVGSSGTFTITPSTGATISSVAWTVVGGGSVIETPASTSANNIFTFKALAKGTAEVSATVTFSDNTTATTNKVTVTVGNTPLTLSRYNLSLGYYQDYGTITASFGNEILTTANTTWEILNNTTASATSNGYVYVNTIYGPSITVSALANTPAGKPVTLRATYTDVSGATHIGECTVTVNFGSATVSAIVYNNYDYALTDVPSEGSTSIADQIDSWVRRNYSYNYGYNYTVLFPTVGSFTNGYLSASRNTEYYYSDLDDVVFSPSANLTTVNSTAQASIPFTVKVYSGYNTTTAYNTYSGTIGFTIKEGAAASGDINYSGVVGDSIYFDASDFDDFYYNKSNGGSLTYVTFGSPSGGSGTLYADGSKLSSGSQCYVSPSSRQNALDGVYFTPSGTTATKAATVRIPFSAVGTRGNYGSNRTISGTVVISYLNGSAKDITYTFTSDSVDLSVSDFTDAYRQVMGTNAPSDLTIQFQDVPSNGTLIYHKNSSASNTVTLRSSNIKSYRFTTRTSGSNQLADVTYEASGSKTDTISYIAYTGGTARFTGKVVFKPSPVSGTVIVTLSCPGSAGISFNLAEFTKANAVVIANTSQIRFTMPSRGTLTYNGAAVGYTGVTVPVSMVNSIFYKPNAGVNGVDTVAFVCQDASGNQIGTGQVNVVVSGNTNTSTTTPGGVTNIKQFTDVPSGAWYSTALSDLVNKGIVQGMGGGKAEPRGTLNYGQALKMILRAAGYPAQTEPAGNDWAINYKNLAVSNGIVDSSVSLTAPISRDAVVEMAAKALKVAPVTDNSPFKDSNNGYAIALNRTNPQIIIGNEDGTFNGGSTLLRQEVWMIVYRMNQYVAMQSSNQMPDGI